MELSQSDERFLVPDSEDEELNNCEAWDLILGLKALAAARRKLYMNERNKMDGDKKSPKKKQQSIFPSFDSEDVYGPQPTLVSDTVSSDTGSSGEKHNVTVIECKPSKGHDSERRRSEGVSTPSEYISNLQVSQQAMLIPETMESFDAGPSPHMSQTGPFIVPDSPSQDIQESSFGTKDKDMETDDEVSFNPRLLPTLASQSVDDRKGESQCLHLRLSPSQPESMQSSDPPDQIGLLIQSPDKEDAFPTTPIKNPQTSLSCRKLSLKDPSPSKHPTHTSQGLSFEMPLIDHPVLSEEDDKEANPKGKSASSKDGIQKSKSKVIHSMGLFLDTEEEEAMKSDATSQHRGESSREAGIKDADQDLPSWQEERNLRRQKREERLKKIIGKPNEEDDEKEISPAQKEKKAWTVDEAASLVILEEQDSVEMDVEHTMSYEYNHPQAPDQNVNIIPSSLPGTGGQTSKRQMSPSQSEEFHGFEKEEDETAVPSGAKAPISMQAEKEDGDRDQQESVNKSPSRVSMGSGEASVSHNVQPNVSVKLSEGSTLMESTIQDPYTFYGSQSQNIADVSAQPVSDKQKRTEKIKEMRKVLKKKAPVKQNVGSSSTDEAGAGRHTQRSLTMAKRRKQKSALKQSKKQSSLQKNQTETYSKDKARPDPAEEDGNSAHSSRPTGLMLPPIVESPVKRTSAAQDAPTLIVSRSSPADGKLSRKGTTVSFSDEQQTRGGVSVQGASDQIQGERERKTVREVMALVVTRETTTEVFDGKGQLVQQTVTSEVIRRTVLEPPWPSTEVHVSEQMFSPGLSPSRSASTLTSGDLADVSSSSFSRTLSSGSKGSNPSLEAGIQSYPTPAQRRRSIEPADPSSVTSPSLGQQSVPVSTKEGNVTTAESGRIDAKRLSSGSNTGQDLFGTPNESLIARCDSSHVGGVVSSSHSTPAGEPQAHCSHQEAPAAEKVTNNDNIQQGKASTYSEESPIKISTGRSKAVGKLTDLATRGRKSPRNKPSIQSAKTPEEGGSRKRKKGADEEKEEEEEEEGVTPKGKGRLKRDRSLSLKSKGKGKRTVSEREPSVEKDVSSSKKARRNVGQDTTEAEKEGSEEKGASGVSTGFVVQGGVAGSPSVKGDLPALSSRSSDASEALTTDAPEPITLSNIKSRLEIGEQIMAKWNDGFFYPGILNKMQLHTQKFQIKFHDGTQKWVDAHGLLMAKELPVGQSVMVMNADGFYECGMIMRHSMEPMQDGKVKVIYHVERDDGVTQKCDRGSLLLSEDQAACLLSEEDLSLSTHLLKSPTKIGDVSLDNLVEGKRKPKMSKDRSSTSSIQEKGNTTSAADVSTEEAPSACRRQQGPVATSTPTPKPPSRAAKGSTGSTGKQPKMNTLGGVVSSPVAPRKSTRVRTELFEKNLTVKPELFKGKAFLITHIEKTEQQKAEEKRLLQDSSLDTSADDTVEEETEYHPFVKDQLTALIKAGGGEVMESYSDEKIQEKGKANCYVVASEHQRTVKYLQGLACGLTLVSHEWILHSVSQNRLLGLRAFLLPAGISLEKKRLMEWKGPCMDLVGQTMMVVSNRPDFMEVWSSILKSAGCHLIGKFPPRASKIDPGTDFVVTDVTCPANVIRKCSSLEVPVVSSEWVAQCLTNNHLVEPNAHEQYKHDYTTHKA